MNIPGLPRQFGPYAVGFIFMIAVSGAVSAAQRAERQDACTDTTEAAFKACRFEAEDDFWIGVGRCENLANESASDACEDAAELAQLDAQEGCDAQSDAREEICDALGEAPFDPRIQPSRFVDPASIGRSVAANRFLPVVRGRVLTYAKGTERITVTVTDQTKTILGVKCAVVHDIVRDDGELVEDTVDWLAQDVYGNVWYFGEIAKNYEDGELANLDGSWKAGVDGAKAGILMKAAPGVGAIYRQEFDLGNAEDMAQVLSRTGSATVPAASCRGTCLITKDFTPLSPDHIEHKYYAPGIGMILEVDPETGERLELIGLER